jgi:hypothetical protein
MAARKLGGGLVGVAHHTISSSPLDVVREHYRQVAASLILGNVW